MVEINTENKNEGSIETTEVSSTDNIFADLSGGLDFWRKEQAVEVSEVKDKEYYLRLSLSILWIFNIILFLSLLFGFLYIKVQNNETNYSKSFLDPFCFLILWDLIDKNTWDYCSSVSALNADYDSRTRQLKSDISEKLSKITLNLLEIDNFVNSKEVSFLLSNKLNKIKVLHILNDFDQLKNDFSGWDKKLISCNSMKINSDNIIEATCDVYSSSWERADSTSWLWIVWDSWDRKTSLIEWTSISTAASFLNFIEKNPEYNFQLLDKQKVFNSEVVWEWPYVKKTKLELKMKYNNLKNNLSL